MRESIAGRLVGARVRRVEDRRLLTGRGRYVDDVTVEGMAHAAFLRSPHPHALIKSIDITMAASVPGVLAVFTGRDMVQMTNPFMGMTALDGLYDPIYYALCTDRVRLVGDPVAIVVAESRRVAEDACERIEVEYEALPGVGTIAQALDATIPPIWPRAKGNVMWRDHQVHGDVDGAFAKADRVITETFTQHRISNQPMETRGLVAEIDHESGQLVFRSATQSAHSLKWVLALLLERQPISRSIGQLWRDRERVKAFGAKAKAFLAANPGVLEGSKSNQPAMMQQMKTEPARGIRLTAALLGLLARDPGRYPRVVAGDVGGAFGSKIGVTREDVATAAAALRLGRSVKWIEDRNENLMVGGQAREETLRVQAAVTSAGEILGLKVDMKMDVGAYPGFPFGCALFAQMVRVMFPGPYRVGALAFDTTLTASNKGTYVAYRGPWAVETWVRERLLDRVAAELGLSRAEVRLRNIVAADELPTPMLTGPMLDVRMSAKTTLERALELAGFDDWPERQAAARAEGRVLGMGLATFIEAAPGPPGYFDIFMPGMASAVGLEPAHAVLEADGAVSVHTQQVPHGQGIETTMAQVAADQLGVPVDAVTVRYGDTARSPFGLMGTGGSRSAAMAGGVVTLAARDLRDKIVEIGADLLEASPEDLVVEDGEIHVVGTPSVATSFADVATEALRRGSLSSVPDEAIRVTRDYDGGEGGWSQATHVCWVEVDLETGLVAIPRYVVVEDCGEIINPAIVDGQIRGGVAQGVGQVLYEKASYDADGVFQSGTFMDYLIPTAMEIPQIEIHHVETPSGVFANYRGVGEGGMICAPAAITSAIEDALSHRGVRITESYLPPSRILELAGVIETG